jgi:hypothetical protein
LKVTSCGLRLPEDTQGLNQIQPPERHHKDEFVTHEADMRGIEPDDSELAYRRGYQAGAVETFHAVEQFLDPATREGLRAWIDDVLQWRTKAMLGSPPMWRLRIPRPSKD